MLRKGQISNPCTTGKRRFRGLDRRKPAWLREVTPEHVRLTVERLLEAAEDCLTPRCNRQGVKKRRPGSLCAAPEPCSSLVKAADSGSLPSPPCASDDDTIMLQVVVAFAAIGNKDLQPHLGLRDLL